MSDYSVTPVADALRDSVSVMLRAADHLARLQKDPHGVRVPECQEPWKTDSVTVDLRQARETRIAVF